MPDSIETRVIEFARLYGLLARSKGVLLAVSGGADSIALMHILETLRARGFIDAELVCAHVNHRLRDAQSDQDERFVIEQAHGLGLPSTTARVDVRDHARQHRLSLETAARELRFAALSQMARDRGCGWIATGHQKNDNAETVIHRLRRGTGLRGLAGIRPVRELSGLWLARPLLCLTRDDVLQYLGEHGLPWREDHTNIDTAYTRNYIRHRLLPVLQRESQRPIVEELSDLAAASGRLYDRIRQEADNAWRTLVMDREGKVSIRAPDLVALFEPVAIELIRLVLASLRCGERDLTEYHYRGVLRLARRPGDGKSLALPGRFFARHEQDAVIIGKSGPDADRPTDIHPVTLNVPGVTWFAASRIDARILRRDETQPEKIKRDKEHPVEYLDLDRLKLPLVVRSRRAGDRFQPLGMADEKKVGKFLTTAKVPHDRRKGILVFADRERIVWVCPVRISEWAKVTANTQRVLVLKVAGRQSVERSGEV